MTQRFDCSVDAQRREGIAAAGTAIRAGKLVVLPTDTVYGVAADAFTPRAITGLLAAKGRGRAMPVPVLIADADTLEGVATNVGSSARLLTRACWPGGLTVIVEHPPSLAWDLGDGQGTVAVRVPDDDLARDLLRETGPLGVSSANRSGHPPARTADEAIEALGDLVAVVLDDGPRSDGEPSTIVDCTVDPPRVLRVGAVSQSRLQYLVPTLRTVTADPDAPEPTSAQPPSTPAQPEPAPAQPSPEEQPHP
ncbi:MAG: threonylcarbamoyl-AMP synthase [Geodermatophilaceae bacterium]|nr:threonylcarbamoyl-AMP synthase [Geodermatophilaceae bacterium]MDQ3475560.1 L-threonylcarbamoyladenylate synthase [Actinomycetota bacterium]